MHFVWVVGHGWVRVSDPCGIHHHDVCRGCRWQHLFAFVLPGVVLFEELFAHKHLVADATLVLGKHELGVAPLDVRAQAAEMHEAQAAVLAVVRSIASVLVNVVFEAVLKAVAFGAERTLVLAFRLHSYCLLK